MRQAKPLSLHINERSFKSMFKKISAIILLAMMIFSMVACVGTPVDKGGNDGESGLEYVTFRWGNSYYSDYYPNTVGTSTTIGDALLARYKYLEEELGLTFIVEDMDNESDELLKRFSIAQDVPDIFMGTSRKIGWPLYKEDAIYALEEIETIDSTSEKWGTKNFLQCAKYNGVEYGFFPWEWAYVPSYSGVMLFNVNLLKEAGAALPYEYQESNSWNWENFEELLRTLKRNNSELLPWTMGSINDDGWYMMMANGLQAVVEDTVNGGYTWGYDCNEGIDALNWLNELYIEGLYVEGGKQAFINETAFFYSGGLGDATNTIGKENADGTTSQTIATSVDTYGVISFPYGPNGNSSTVSANVYWTTPMNFIIKGSENEADVIGLVMEELFAPLDGVQSWKDYLYSEIVHDDRDYDNIMFMFDNCNYDYSVQMYETAGNLDGYFKAAIKGEMSAAAALESARNLANEEIDANITSLGK